MQEAALASAVREAERGHPLSRLVPAMAASEETNAARTRCMLSPWGHTEMQMEMKWRVTSKSSCGGAGENAVLAECASEGASWVSARTMPSAVGKPAHHAMLYLGL